MLKTLDAILAKRNRQKREEKEEERRKERERAIRSMERREIKIVFIGGISADILTAFVKRYVYDKYDEPVEQIDQPKIYSKSIVLKGEKISLILWSTPSDKMYFPLFSTYIVRADGIVVGYDVTNRESLEMVKELYDGLIRMKYPDAPSMVIGGKADLVDSREISWDEGDEYARELGDEIFFEGKI